MDNNTKLPKVTYQILQEYNELQNRLKGLDPSWLDEEVNAVADRIYELEEQYNWLNEEFTDPTTGKKGVKDVAGEILIPARYDGFNTLGCYFNMHRFPHAALKDGKYGIVKADGSGKELSDFCFDLLSWQPGTSLFEAYWNGDTKHHGFVDVLGNVICPNILTGHDDRPSGIMTIWTDKKIGAIDLDSYLCVLPEYDEIYPDDIERFVFKKDGKEGYITDTGEFVTKEQLEDENDPHFDAYVLNMPL
jgi:hypothetical protein